MSTQDTGTGAGCSRREFIRQGGLLAAGAAAGLSIAPDPARGGEVGAPGGDDTPPIPRRVLGRTGVEVSVIGLGTALLGHQNNNNPEIEKPIAVFSEAIDRGINYIDTARIYGRAEEALKTVLKARREKVFLVTKLWPKDFTAVEAEGIFHQSLEKMGVESVDVLHLHSAGNQDVDKVLGPGGTWEYIAKAKKAGKARFVGITGHCRPANFVRLLETDAVDVMMVAMNFVDRHIYGFEEKVLPLAVKRKVGVMAMKVYGGVKGGFPNYGAKTPHPSQMNVDHHVRSIGYVKALEGVTGMVIGAHSREQLVENIRRVATTKALSKEEFDKLCEEGRTLAADWTPRFGPVV